MAGTLKQLDDDRWQLRVYVGRDAKGRVQQVNRNFAGGKRAAQKALAQLVLEVGNGQVAKHPLSVAELLDRWLADRKPRLTPSSYKEYQRSVEKDLKPALGRIRLDKLTAQQLDNFYTTQLNKGLSPSTVHKQHAHLSGALNMAVKWGLIARNPDAQASAPAAKRVRVRPPKVDLVRAMVRRVSSFMRQRLHRNKDSVVSCSGLLIHATVGSSGGVGGLRTNRSGWAA